MKKLSPAPNVPRTNDGVFVPAVHDDAAHHVGDAQRAFHSKRDPALYLLLRGEG